jgi:Fur family ferric uptake transcriptional regulator
MSGTADTWSERALAELSDAGFRSGEGRRKVVQLIGRQGCALTALEIDRQLAGVGRATVYRSLEQLESLGLIQRVDVGGDAAGYERVDPGGHHHHHIVCERCGRVIAFEDERLERAITALAKRPDFTVASHEVTLRGECASCAGPKRR